MINNPVIVAREPKLETVSTLETSATGRIPDYDHERGIAELTNVFVTSATGALE